MVLSVFLVQQLKRLSQNLRKIRFPKLPSIYLVFPKSGPQSKKGTRHDGAPPESSLKFKRPPALILDTSAIIDGRIADIVESGFLEGTLVVTTGVMQELQTIADSKNTLKRNRGRRGLDVLQELKKSKALPYKNVDYTVSDLSKLDESLIKLAKKAKGKLITVDYNLNKVSRLRGVKILNVNELANVVKTIVLPGEKLTVKVIQEGKEKDQGVGYLPDGTMVVVEEGKELLNQEVETVVERLLQTEAGRMIFVKLAVS